MTGLDRGTISAVAQADRDCDNSSSCTSVLKAEAARRLTRGRLNFVAGRSDG